MPWIAAVMLWTGLGAFSTAAIAQTTTVQEIGRGIVDHDRIEGQRWMRLKFDPLISGPHTIRLSWDSDAELQFTIFRWLDETVSDESERIATTSNSATPGEWTGVLDETEDYYLGIWSSAGVGSFIASIEADIPEPELIDIISHPQSLRVTEGEAASFSVAASGGSAALSYQWSADGAPIAGATDSTLLIAATTLAHSGTVYTVDITDGTSSVASSAATLTVTPIPLVIDTQPVDLTVTEGDEAVFSVAASGGSAALSYQWSADGAPIADATDSSLLIPATTLTQSGTVYTVEVTDGTSSITSSAATLTVTPIPLVIDTQPVDLTVTEGDEAVFSVAASGGSAALSYQWSADGAPIAGATDSTLLIAATTLAQSGTVYTVEVTDGSSTATSSAATLTVTAIPLAIDTQPVDLTVTEGEAATFSVAASGGSAALSYQWSVDGAPIAGATDSTLLIAATTLAQSGTAYTVEISDGTSTVTSADATLTVTAIPLAIDTQPVDLSVTEGEDAVFSVVASGGSAELTYQWSVDGAPIADATDSSLLIPATTLAQSGTAYTVDVTDGTSSITSSAATLMVEVAPLTIVEQPLDVEVIEGEDAVFSITATGSGTLTYQWFADDIAIADAVENTLTLAAVALDQSGVTYTVTVTDDNASLTSLPATLLVQAAPLTITESPADLTVTEGEEAIFSVMASGGVGALSYQWFADDELLIDETAATLTIASASMAQSGTVYLVQVADEEDSSGYASATLTVEPTPLSIDVHPGDLSVTEGDDAEFSVTTLGGSGTLDYQWFINGVPIPDAIQASYLLESASLTENGSVLHVEISDDFGTITSNSATLEVTPIPPPVTSVMIGQGVLDADKALGPRWVRLDFDALATATHVISVSWDSDADLRFNVFHADGTRLSTSIVQGANPGIWSGELVQNEQYYLGLWSAGGVANYTASIEATVPLTIDSHPADRTVTEGEDASFFVTASGSGSLVYQWYADGEAIPGETSDALTHFVASLADSGAVFSVSVSNEADTVMSNNATLTVNEPLVLGLYSSDADTAAWMLDGPATTLDYSADETTDAWGRVLLRIGDRLLVGGDFGGIKQDRHAKMTARPYLAAFDAVSGQPDHGFSIPSQVNSVVRALAYSPYSDRLYVGGDFGLLMLDPDTGFLDTVIDVENGNVAGRVFDIAVTDTQLYIGGDFKRVDGRYRGNLARLSLAGELDETWSPEVTYGFVAGRSAPVQSLAISPSAEKVYVGGNFQFIDGVEVAKTAANNRISLLAVSALDGTVQAERFSPDIGSNEKGLTAHDIAVTRDYVIVAWGGPNYLSFHALSGELLKQYSGKGDIQALQIVGSHLFVGHHGEFFGFKNNPIPAEAVESLDPEIIVPYKFHSFRIDDPEFPPEQAWKLKGAFGVWGIAAAEDSIWIAGNLETAGINDRAVEGLVRFPALDQGQPE